jgi:hypothetical protein
MIAITRFIPILVTGWMLAGCRQELEVLPSPDSPSAPSLLINSSFELGDMPNIDGWRPSSPSSVVFSTIVPPEGGIWSVSLDSHLTSEISLLAIVPTTPGTDIFRLSLWTRKTGLGGTASIVTKRSDSLFVSQTAGITTPDWSEMTILDTISLAPGDSVGVLLSGGRSLSTSGTSFFDRCTLVRF